MYVRVLYIINIKEFISSSFPYDQSMGPKQLKPQHLKKMCLERPTGNKKLMNEYDLKSYGQFYSPES